MEIEFPEIMRLIPDGLILELGVMSGTTFNQICEAANPRQVFGFDWFHGLPEPWDDSPAGTFSTGGQLPRIASNGELIVGKIEDTLPHFLIHHLEPIAFVHFDLDLYAPTAFALDILPFQRGSILAFDEIDHATRNIDHEQRAFWEWMNRGNRVRFLGRRHYASWVVQIA